MEEKILSLLSSSDKAYDVHEINDYLGFATVDDLRELLKGIRNRCN